MLIISFLLGRILHLIMPEIESQYKNPCLFRPWSDPRMWFFFAHPFALSLIMAFTWSPTKHVFKGKFNNENGMLFGLFFWIISLPGLLLSYSTFPLTLIIVISWAFTGLVQTTIAGFMISKTIK
jgi:hypothetical protein